MENNQKSIGNVYGIIDTIFEPKATQSSQIQKIRVIPLQNQKEIIEITFWGDFCSQVKNYKVKDKVCIEVVIGGKEWNGFVNNSLIGISIAKIQ